MQCWHTGMSNHWRGGGSYSRKHDLARIISAVRVSLIIIYLSWHCVAYQLPNWPSQRERERERESAENVRELWRMAAQNARFEEEPCMIIMRINTSRGQPWVYFYDERWHREKEFFSADDDKRPFCFPFFHRDQCHFLPLNRAVGELNAGISQECVDFCRHWDEVARLWMHSAGRTLRK